MRQLILLMAMSLSVSWVAYASTEFEGELVDYFRAYERYEKGETEQGDLALESIQRLSEIVVKDFSSPQAYQAELGLINSHSKEHPNAVASLAFRLESEWESRYLLRYYQEQSRRLRYVQGASQIASVLSGGAALMRSPGAVASSFGVLREALMFGSAVPMGVAAGTAVATSREGTTAIPDAPAFHLYLARSVSEKALIDQERRDLVKTISANAAALTTGILWTKMAIGGIRAGAAVLTTGEVVVSAPINPLLTIALGVGISVVADQATGWVISQAQAGVLKSKLHRCALEFDRAVRSRNSYEIQRSTRELLMAAFELEAFYNYDLLKQHVEYQIDLRRHQDQRHDVRTLETAQKREVSKLIRKHLSRQGRWYIQSLDELKLPVEAAEALLSGQIGSSGEDVLVQVSSLIESTGTDAVRSDAQVYLESRLQRYRAWTMMSVGQGVLP